MKIPFLSKLTPYLRSNQVLSLAGNLVASGLTVVSVSLLFRALPVQDIGAWVFFLTMLGLGDALRAGGLTTAFIRAYSGAARARAAEVMGSTWALALLITGTLVALALLARLWPGSVANVSLALFIRWFPVTFVLTLPSFIATCVLQAEQRFEKLLYIRLLTQVTFILGVIALMLLHQTTLERVVYCHLAAAGLTSLVALACGWTRFGDLSARTLACCQELGHFGKYSVGSYIGSSLLRSSDTFLINFLLGPAALAVYNLAQRFLELIEIPLRSFLATAMPALSAASNRGNKLEMARLIRKNAGLLTWLLLPVVVGTVLLADVPIRLIGGAKYAGTEAANLLRIAIGMAILFPIDRFSGVALDVLGKPRLNLLKVFLMLAINVVGDFVGIRLCGNVYGVALASFPTILAGFLFGYFLLNKSLPITISQILRVGLVECQLLLRRVLGRPARLPIRKALA
jgi:O-antigen/teichoic acid export membrane protein